MIPAITREGMIEVDRIMTDELGIGVPLMMEQAGYNLAKVAVDYYTKFKLEKIVIVAGSGNNGGGGMVAARRLKNWGLDVSLILPKGMPTRDIPQSQLEKAQDCGVRIHYQLPTQKTEQTLVIDAYIGYNFKGELIGDTLNVILWMRHQKLISLDIPSGVDSSTGLNPGLLEPITTVTLAWPKTGILNLHPSNIGKVYLADIGVPYWVFDNPSMYSGGKANISQMRELASQFARDSVIPIHLSKDGWSFTMEE
ncbi:MAG: NAD(P)H-hydrate epimerase [Candidatus Kariarchaeaceae archaeon]|jgi:NAD(P)H-hydrate epimerase